jgi:predicted AlkP superfamily phosphohydrolase/phosphomutase
MLELVRYADGRVALQDDEGGIIWSGDADDKFIADMGEIVESDQLDEVADWLEDNGYLAPGEGIDIIDEGIEDEDEDEDGEEIH